MLKKFSVQGFKNFDQQFTLDFSDIRDYRFNTNCIKNGMINKAIIYGKNATGKTNFGLALFDIVTHLSGKNVGPGLYDYYLNVNNSRGYAEFSYTFAFDNHIIDYTYRKNEKRTLIYEELHLDGDVLLAYNYALQSGDIDGLKEITPTLNWVFQDEYSVFRYVMNNTMLDDNHPLRRMMHFVSKMLWFRNLDQNRYIGYTTNPSDYYDFILDEVLLEKLQQFMEKAGIEEKLVIKQDPSGKDTLYFDTKTPLPFFKVASSGTKALYNFYYWCRPPVDVSFMYIDEFDAYYHYELSEAIVEMLEGMSGFQTILTSHNTNLLTNRIMRPDCYFILSNQSLCSLANATSRELREGHNLEKLYMGGEFDGDA